jgi:ubiquinone/menaquinone biosynthesis C-methylase UbiE
MQHFVSDGVDTVVCCETLEHTPDAEAICRNAHRMLMTGGVFLVTAAGDGRGEHSAVDGGPLRDGEFYRNVDRYHLETWLEMFHFRMIDTATPGDIYAIAVK